LRFAVALIAVQPASIVILSAAKNPRICRCGRRNAAVTTAYQTEQSQNGTTRKIKLKTWRIFHHRKRGLLKTTSTTHNTTFSPSKNHLQAPTFPKTPPKIPAKKQNPGSHQGSTFFLEKSKAIAKQTASEPAPQATVQPAP
jgi:hypothetical protein